MSELANNSLIAKAYEILNEIKAGRTSDDERIHIRMVIRAIRTAYAKILQDYLDEKDRNDEKPDESMYVTYCVDMSAGDFDKITNTVLRTARIPEPAFYGGRPAIKYVYTSEKETTIQKSTGKIDARTKAKGGAYSPKTPSYYFEAGRLNALFPKEFLPYKQNLHIVFMPKDPMETGTDECYDIWSNDFPINQALWAKVKEYVIRFDAQVMQNGLEAVDISNDSNFSNSLINKLKWAFKS